MPDALPIGDIISRLPRFREKAAELSDILLTNLVMIGEVPAPTFGEEERTRLVEDRFVMGGLDNCSGDEMNNALGVIQGTEGESNILVVAHADTIFAESVDHTINVQPERVIGPAVGDNALGLAVLATLPHILEHLDIRLRNNLVLMAGTRSLGPGNLAGVRFFLRNFKRPIKAGVCLEGVQLGRLSYSSIGMLRGQVRCLVPEEYDWTRFGVVGAIRIMNEVINKIAEIPLPGRPRTSVVFGSIEGGSSYSVITKETLLRLEVRSESADEVKRIRQRIISICAEVSAEMNANVKLKVLAVREPGGINFGHPLVVNVREIMKALKIKPRMSPSTSELTAFIQRNIPSITLGLTSGDHMTEVAESLLVKPMYKGIAQLIGVLLAIDGGYCDES